LPRGTMRSSTANWRFVRFCRGLILHPDFPTLRYGPEVAANGTAA
jgi:hypothetical protein